MLQGLLDGPGGMSTYVEDRDGALGVLTGSQVENLVGAQRHAPGVVPAGRLLAEVRTDLGEAASRSTSTFRFRFRSPRVNPLP